MNPQQLQAVRAVRGPVLVLAGAGSGKTRVITEKIAHLIGGGHVQARHIAAITFTNKAAREMRERVGRRLRDDAAQGLTVSTFHSLGLKLLQIEHARAGLRRGFSVFDADDAGALLRELMPKGARNDAVDAVRQLISRAKNQTLTPEQAARLAASEREREAADLYAHYQQRLAAFNAVDFDDLIRLPVMLLESDAEAAGAWRERIRYLLVDEYQDTNGAQYRLLRALAGARADFTCVGDDDQSIYGWRGADPENLQRLAHDYPGLEVIMLEQNYRCARRILRAANALIAHNPRERAKKLWSEHAEGPAIRVEACPDDGCQAERVAAEIAFLAQRDKAPWSAFAVLFRGNHQSRPLEKALQLARVPYHLSGGTAFLDRGEVKDALAWLRVVANPDDDAAFLRAVTSPRREIGATTLARLGELAGRLHLPLSRAAERVDVVRQLPARPAAALAAFADLLGTLRRRAAHESAASLCRALIEESGLLAALRASASAAQFERRQANLLELADWFEGARGSAGDLAAQLALLTHADRDEPGNAVRLMSLHAAKGLEFDYVFIVGCEDGTLPHAASLEEGRLEEERRLLYVGITRARRQLQLSYCTRTRRFGEVVALEPSRFLAELPQADLAWRGQDEGADTEHREERAHAHLARLAALLAEG
ncbi:MAG TPA: UvrD-helicase domain-containing protein [Xanthomonadaceae bacterium]|nr:UvrD-helicase domain-containing protein [Xanthomonadaceae bacterium]